MTAPGLTVDDRGTGRPFLLLHGGAGPRSVLPFAERLAATGGVRTITPTNPGFSGTPRAAELETPAALAARYGTLLAELGVEDATVVGFSVGGWVAAELAVLRDPRVGRVVVVDGVGIAVDGHPVADVSALSPAELAARSHHDPARTAPDMASLPPAARAEMGANVAAVVRLGGGMTDPTLRERLGGVDVPALVLWGESDGIADPDYGRAYAAAFADGRFELVRAAGHVPQLEQPEDLAARILAFSGAAQASVPGA